MKYNNDTVAKMWGNLRLSNEVITNHENTLRFFKSGAIYSYNLRIGEVKNGKKIVYNCTAGGGQFYSVTTSKHVNLIKQYADEVISY